MSILGSLKLINSHLFWRFKKSPACLEGLRVGEWTKPLQVSSLSIIPGYKRRQIPTGKSGEKEQLFFPPHPPPTTETVKINSPHPRVNTEYPAKEVSFEIAAACIQGP